MEMSIDFPGGKRVDAHFDGFTVQTDQPKPGGDNSAPSPFQLFLASLGTCAGIYVLGFCRQRNLSTDGIRLVQRMTTNPANGMVASIEIEIQVPPTFPANYYDALVRSAEQCKVKKTIDNPPSFVVRTQVIA
ncbi:MAG TPA: OsmC family protein [Anaerolineaceae bacterium]|nr:OsmC family protein [Anaerolineaceae bacterium]